MTKHITVFKNEIIENLNIKPNGIYVDLTLGGGGHTLEVLNKLKNGTLIAFDIDATAIEQFIYYIHPDKSEMSEIDNTTKVLVYNNNRVYLVNQNFENLKSVLSNIKITHVDGIYADLGWSTDQLQGVAGLSFNADEELDMRFDKSLGVKAKDLLNVLSETQLKDMFTNYADIEGKTLFLLVKQITNARKLKAVETVADLNKIITSVTLSATNRGSRFERTNSLPARVFQALRIAVNSELSTLQSMLIQSFEILAAGGYLQVITFHSGEDRIVKNQMKKWVADKQAKFLYPEGYIEPSLTEVEINISARSAKLRAVKKL